MTENKVEDKHARISKVLDRIMNADNSDIDPVELCALLVEMEERIAHAPIEHCGVEDCPECNKEAYKAGALAALEDAGKAIRPCLNYCVAQNGREDCKNCGLTEDIFDDLKKKYDRG